MEALLLWLESHWLEVIGSASSLLYLYLEIKEKNALWVVGFLSSLMYVFVFWQAKLYADTVVYVYYVLISIYGFLHWKGYLKGSREKKEVETRYVSTPILVGLLVLSAVLIPPTGYFLDHYTEDPIPYADATTSVLSLVATAMLAQKWIQHWYLWLFINLFAAILYVYRGLYPTAFLFFVNWVLSFVGLYSWRKAMRKADSSTE